MRPQKHRVFAVVHGELGDGHVAGLFHRLGQQRVGPAAGFIRHQKIRRFEVDGIHFLVLHELQDLHRLRGFGFDLLDFFRFDNDVLALAILVALDDLVAFDDALVMRAPELLFDTRVVVAVQHVEGDVIAARAGKQLYRH